MENKEYKEIKDSGLKKLHDILHELDGSMGYYISVSKLYENEKGEHKLDNLVYLGKGFKLDDTSIALLVFAESTEIIKNEQRKAFQEALRQNDVKVPIEAEVVRKEPSGDENEVKTHPEE